MRSVTIVGPGRMGLAIAEALARSGELAEVVVFGRRPEAPRHPAFGLSEVRYVYGMEPLPTGCAALFLAVAEEALSEVALHVAAQGDAPAGCAAFHLSGSLPSDVLAPLHTVGFQVGVFNPWIVASAGASGAQRLKGARIGVTASPEGFRVAHEMASLMGAEVLQIPAARQTLAHAVVSMAEGYLPVLVGGAIPLLDRAGLSPEEAADALVPLLRSVLAEMEEQGPAETLRAVARRVDDETLDVHLRALDGDERRMYAWLREILARYSGRPGEELPEGSDRSSEFETVSRE